MAFIPAFRNFDGIQFGNLRRTLDPKLNALHDELSDAYYNYWREGKSKDFQGYDVQATTKESKELFDKLHGLIFVHYNKLFHEANLALPVNDRIDEEKYDVVRGVGDDLEDHRIKYRKSGRAAAVIADLANAGIEITIPAQVG